MEKLKKYDKMTNFCLVQDKSKIVLGTTDIVNKVNEIVDWINKQNDNSEGNK